MMYRIEKRVERFSEPGKNPATSFYLAPGESVIGTKLVPGPNWIALFVLVPQPEEPTE